MKNSANSLLSQQDIIELSKRYIPEDEIVDFPGPGALFCILSRSTISAQDNEKWQFSGYEYVILDTYDTEVKPLGKVIFQFFITKYIPL